jgi:hypothetical protein
MQMGRMEEGDALTADACFPVALHPIRNKPDPDDSGQVLALPPNRAGRELPRPISAEMNLAPFDRLLRNSRNRATGY